MTVTINGTTGVSGVAGSASTPALIGSDADSGYYINSANEPNASVNGTAVWNAASTFGFKNRIINGAMVIDQRNAGASVSANSAFVVDRFFIDVSQASKMTCQQSSTAPTGFVNSMVYTSSSAYTVLSGDYFQFSQFIEGLNIADLAWGTASAATVTLSFWVRSSLTGTFGGSIRNNGLNRSYPFTYTINAANTFEYKTITIPGDQSGTWLTTNGTGLRLTFGLGNGSTYSGAAGSWAAANYQNATGATSLVGTNGATFYITGVQLEKGSTATSFDYRPYGTELQLCQRYCFVQSAESKNYAIFASMIGIAQSGGTQVGGPAQFPQQMRSAPSITPTGSFRMSAYNTIYSTASAPTFSSTRTTTTGTEWELVSLSGMTAGNAYYLQDQGSGTAKIVYSAEL